MNTRKLKLKQSILLALSVTAVLCSGVSVGDTTVANALSAVTNAEYLVNYVPYNDKVHAPVPTAGNTLTYWCDARTEPLPAKPTGLDRGDYEVKYANITRQAVNVLPNADNPATLCIDSSCKPSTPTLIRSYAGLAKMPQICHFQYKAKVNIDWPNAITRYPYVEQEGGDMETETCKADVVVQRPEWFDTDTSIYSNRGLDIIWRFSGGVNAIGTDSGPAFVSEEYAKDLGKGPLTLANDVLTPSPGTANSEKVPAGFNGDCYYDSPNQQNPLLTGASCINPRPDSIYKLGAEEMPYSPYQAGKLNTFNLLPTLVDGTTATPPSQSPTSVSQPHDYSWKTNSMPAGANQVYAFYYIDKKDNTRHLCGIPGPTI